MESIPKQTWILVFLLLCNYSFSLFLYLTLIMRCKFTIILLSHIRWLWSTSWILFRLSFLSSIFFLSIFFFSISFMFSGLTPRSRSWSRIRGRSRSWVSFIMSFSMFSIFRSWSWFLMFSVLFLSWGFGFSTFRSRFRFRWGFILRFRFWICCRFWRSFYMFCYFFVFYSFFVNYL